MQRLRLLPVASLQGLVPARRPAASGFGSSISRNRVRAVGSIGRRARSNPVPQPSHLSRHRRKAVSRTDATAPARKLASGASASRPDVGQST